MNRQALAHRFGMGDQPPKLFSERGLCVHVHVTTKSAFCKHSYTLTNILTTEPQRKLTKNSLAHKTIPVSACQTGQSIVCHTLTASPEDFYPFPADLANPFSYSAGIALKNPHNPP